MGWTLLFSAMILAGIVCGVSGIYIRPGWSVVLYIELYFSGV